MLKHFIIKHSRKFIHILNHIKHFRLNVFEYHMEFKRIITIILFYFMRLKYLSLIGTFINKLVFFIQVMHS